MAEAAVANPPSPAPVPAAPAPAPAPAPASAKAPVRSTGTKPTPPTNQADMSPQARFQTMQDEQAAADPWLDTSKVLTRDAEGNLVQRERSGADAEPTVGKPEPAADAPLGDGDQQRIKVGNTEYSVTELNDAITAKAAQDLKSATVPATPQGYKLELDKTALPAGFDFKLASLDDPLKGPGLKVAMEFAHKHNFSQADFAEMLTTYAAATSNENLLLANAAKAQRDALGVSGPARVSAIERWVRGTFGDETARPVLATLATAKQVEMFENIINRLTNQGGGLFSGRSREAPDNSGKVDDATYERMTYTERKEYAERHSNGGRR